MTESEKACLVVTGGLGFIGSHFVRLALDRGYRICNIDKETYAAQKEPEFNTHPSYQHIKGDIVDVKTFPVGTTAILNFAAETHVDRSIDTSSDFIRTNIVGTENLLSVALQYWEQLPSEKQSDFRFLHISTDEVYGSLELDDPAFTEETPYDPSSPYAASKASSDHLVRAWHRTYGLPVLITNCSNNYGPYQFPEKLIPMTIITGLSGRSIPVYGTGENIRDWLYVDDHCEALFEVLVNGRIGETYNIGGETERTNIEVIENICAILDDVEPTGAPHRDQIEFVKDRPGHDRRYAMDISKIKGALKWKPKTEFSSGLEHTVRWYLDNPGWWQYINKTTYNQNRLGLR